MQPEACLVLHQNLCLHLWLFSCLSSSQLTINDVIRNSLSMIKLPEPFLWLDLGLQIIDPQPAHLLQSIDLKEYSFQHWCTQPSFPKHYMHNINNRRNNHPYNFEFHKLYVYLPKILQEQVLKAADSGTAFYAFEQILAPSWEHQSSITDICIWKSISSVKS